MADDGQRALGADVTDAVARLGQLRQAAAAAARPVAQLQTAFSDIGRAAGRMAQPFRRAFAEIGTSWQSALKAYITAPSGAAGWRQRMGALHGLYSSEVGAGLGLGASLLSKGSAALLGARRGQGIGDFLGGKLFGALGLGGGTRGSTAALDTFRNTLLAQIYAAQQIANGLLGTIAGSSSTTAAATASAAATGPAASVAGGGIGGVFSGLFGGIGKFLGFAAGGIVPSAAGGWVLPRNVQPAFLHGGEMVLPAPISEGIQRAIAGGGFGRGGESAGGDLHLHFHGPADGPAVERWFKGLLARSPDVVRNMLRSNALTPRSL
jgi:hypothetical protein